MYPALIVFALLPHFQSKSIIMFIYVCYEYVPNRIPIFRAFEVLYS